MTSATFYTRLRKCLKAAGLPPTGVHILRHTAAKLRRDAGESIEAVSQFLDHCSLADLRTNRRVVGQRGGGDRPVADFRVGYRLSPYEVPLMATFSTIDASKAPAPARPAGPLQKRMSEYEGFLGRLKDGQVGKLTPTKNETARALLLRVAWAARRLKQDVDIWAFDGVVYFDCASPGVLIHLGLGSPSALSQIATSIEPPEGTFCTM